MLEPNFSRHHHSADKSVSLTLNEWSVKKEPAALKPKTILLPVDFTCNFVDKSVKYKVRM